MLWLAVHLPDLPLEVLSRGAVVQRPLAVVQGHGVRQWLCVCNESARAQGLHVGMGLEAAHALVPQLRVWRRDPSLEHAALKNLGAWAGRFTSLVSLESGQGLLLEVGASLDLFGGLERLREQIREGLAGLGYRPCLALAPTPRGAWFLARCGRQEWLTRLEDLPQRLASLPLGCMAFSAPDLTAFREMGLHTLADLAHQPRDALARRFGQSLIDHLDRTLGRTPDPRRPYRPPSRFEGRLVLPAEVVETEALLFPLRRLLLELTGFLIACDGGVQELGLGLLHPRGVPTRLRMGLVAPTRDIQHLLELARHRLESLELTAPVEQLELKVERIMPLAPLAQDLFVKAGTQDEGWQRLVNRLCLRLGPGAVRSMGLVADHRPERAWRYTGPGERSAGQPQGNRPLWLLERPRPLEVRDGRPYLGGALVLKTGPERIESGWWDGQDVARDYFVAVAPQGERLWVFREPRPVGQWFVHGIFG